MQIVNAIHEKEYKIKYQIKKGFSANTYKTEEGLVLKRFLNNQMYQKIINLHDEAFLEYLELLASIANAALVTPEIVFVKKSSLVTSYLREYVPGPLLNGLYPKTPIFPLINVIEEFYNRIKLLENLHLCDIHEENIVYTKDLKIIDLDMSNFTEENEVNHNLRHLDASLFRGIFNLQYGKEIYFASSDKGLEEAYKSFCQHEIDIIAFLQEYCSFIKKEYGTPKYVKSLQKNVFKQ